MQYLFLSLIFLFGAALGSFVSVVADRYNTGLSFFKGRSVCFSCNTTLQKRDLFPVFSFLFLKGRCRYCGSLIPKETLVTELVMGALSVLAFFKSGLSFENLSLLQFFCFLAIIGVFASILLIAVYDLKHFIIPDSFLVSLFILSILHNSYFIILNSSSYLILLNSLISAFIITLPFFTIFMVSKGRWIGFGDIKYMLAIGFFLGLSRGLSAIILSFWIGAAFSLTALSLKYLKSHIGLPSFFNNLTIKSEIPFGPFLSIGMVISFYLNADLFQIHSLLNAF